MPQDYTAWRAAAEARKTIAARMREADLSQPAEVIALLHEGAAAIDHLHATIEQMRRDAKEAERDAREEIRCAVAEAAGVPHKETTMESTETAQEIVDAAPAGRAMLDLSALERISAGLTALTTEGQQLLEKADPSSKDGDKALRMFRER